MKNIPVNAEYIKTLSPCQYGVDNFIQHYGSETISLFELLQSTKIIALHKIWFAIRVLPRHVVETFAINCAFSAADPDAADAPHAAAASADAADAAHAAYAYAAGAAAAYAARAAAASTAAAAYADAAASTAAAASAAAYADAAAYAARAAAAAYAASTADATYAAAYAAERENQVDALIMLLDMPCEY